MTFARLRCPACQSPMNGADPCPCGFRSRHVEGVLDLMTPEQEAEYADFCSAYERVREEEGWGGDDLDLPFQPLRHQDIWDIRRRTFLKLAKLVGTNFPSGGFAIDVGAGNCWLTRYLDEWEFKATAIDVSIGAQDGLAAGLDYIRSGYQFERVRAPMESLPFVSASEDLVVASGSLHYCSDLERTLKEFGRVVNSDGAIIILDTPWYENERAGERALRKSREELRRRFGLDEELVQRSSFLCRPRFDRAVEANRLRYERVFVWPGKARAVEMLKARFFERRIARFPLLVIRKGTP